MFNLCSRHGCLYSKFIGLLEIRPYQLFQLFIHFRECVRREF
jgi:hypothetical protein